MSEKQEDPTKHWMLIVKQAGEGCDYMIGCAIQTYDLGIMTRSEAVAEAKIQFIGVYHPEYGYEERMEYSERTIESMELVAYDSGMDLWAWRAEAQEAEDALKSDELRKKEMSELERLSKKYTTKG